MNADDLAPTGVGSFALVDHPLLEPAKVTQTKLGRLVGVNRQTVIRHVHKLVALGWAKPPMLSTSFRSRARSSSSISTASPEGDAFEGAIADS